MACYEDSFTFLYADHVCTSQETYYGPPRPVAEFALFFYMRMVFVPHRKHTFGPPWPVTAIALLLYM
jgi:hypothetical protein